MLRTREAREIGADLGDKHLGDKHLGAGASDTGDRVQPRDGLLVGAHALSTLSPHLGTALVQAVAGGQWLGHQEALVRADAPDEGWG